MRLEHIAGVAFGHLFGRILRRGVLILAVAASVVVAIYHFTVVGTLMLEANYSVIVAQTVVGVFYAFLALVLLAIWWTMGRHTARTATPAFTVPREVQVAMLVEAVMLGYALARKGGRAN